MKKLFLFIVLCCAVALLHAQGVNRQRADSLEKRLQEQIVNDTSKVRTLVMLGNTYLTFSSTPEEREKAMYYGKLAMHIADSLGDKIGLVGTYSFMGQYFQINGNLPKALENNLTSLKLAEETGRWVDILRIKNSIGAIYFTMEDNKKHFVFIRKYCNSPRRRSVISKLPKPSRTSGSFIIE